MAKLNLDQEPTMDTTSTASSVSGKRKSKKSLIALINLILLIALLVLGYLYYQQKTELQLIKDPQAQAEVAKKEADEVIKMLEKIVVLPTTDEFPEVLTINDAALAIQEQPNLEGVINGDKILLYTKAGKAYIYSPSRNIIVNILPVALQRPQTQPTTTQPAAQPARSTATSSASASASASANDTTDEESN